MRCRLDPFKSVFSSSQCSSQNGARIPYPKMRLFIAWVYKGFIRQRVYKENCYRPKLVLGATSHSDAVISTIILDTSYCGKTIGAEKIGYGFSLIPTVFNQQPATNIEVVNGVSRNFM